MIEHTNQVIYLEDDDVAAVRDGHLNIHRLEMNDSHIRELVTLKLEIQQIMRGEKVPLTPHVLQTKLVRSFKTMHLFHLVTV